MKVDDKFIRRSRERDKWKKKLSGQPKKDAKAAAIYFRPTLTDDTRIRDLAQMTGETKNAIVEMLVHSALRNRSFVIPKLDEQKNLLRGLEGRTETIVSGQQEILSIVEEIQHRTSVQEKIMVSLLCEIYCMVHTAVSLIRTTLLQLLGLTRKETSNHQLAPEVLASFDETSDLTIARSLQDLESAAGFHEIKSGKLTEANLFWKSKLKRTTQEPQQK